RCRAWRCGLGRPVRCCDGLGFWWGAIGWGTAVVAVQPFENADRSGCLLDDDPRVVSLLAFGDLVAVGVAGALELATGDRPDAGGRVVGDAAAFQVEHLSGARAGEVGHDDEARGA